LKVNLKRVSKGLKKQGLGENRTVAIALAFNPSQKKGIYWSKGTTVAMLYKAFFYNGKKYTTTRRGNYSGREGEVLDRKNF